MSLTALVVVLPADADEQFHDARPVPHLFADGEPEEERDTGERRVVHVSLVVHGAVHPVERGLPLGGVRGGQPPQQPGHVPGAVRMPHRGPVDLVDPREHGVLPQAKCQPPASLHQGTGDRAHVRGDRAQTVRRVA
jgi:hypothetical protein